MTYRFGRFSLNSDTRQLLADEGEVHLSPKAFALLLLLLEQRSRALSKAELQDRLWPSTFIGETNLATLVAEVRRALDDSAHDSAYVRTVHRFGYRFVATLAEAPGTPDRGARMYVRTADQQFTLQVTRTSCARQRAATDRSSAPGINREATR